jgi:hypothetical protein
MCCERTWAAGAQAAPRSISRDDPHDASMTKHCDGQAHERMFAGGSNEHDDGRRRTCGVYTTARAVWKSPSRCFSVNDGRKRTCEAVAPLSSAWCALQGAAHRPRACRWRLTPVQRQPSSYTMHIVVRQRAARSTRSHTWTHGARQHAQRACPAPQARSGAGRGRGMSTRAADGTQARAWSPRPRSATRSRRPCSTSRFSASRAS